MEEIIPPSEEALIRSMRRFFCSTHDEMKAVSFCSSHPNFWPLGRIGSLLPGIELPRMRTPSCRSQNNMKFIRAGTHLQYHSSSTYFHPQASQDMNYLPSKLYGDLF